MRSSLLLFTMHPALENSLSLLVCLAGIKRYLWATLTRDGYRSLPLPFHHANGSSVRARRGVFNHPADSTSISWSVLWPASELKLEKILYRESPDESSRSALVPAVALFCLSVDILSSTAFVKTARAHFFAPSPV